MKNRVFLLFVFMLVMASAICREPDKEKKEKKEKKKITTSYDRSSLSLLVLDYEGYKYRSKLKNNFGRLEPPVKFDINDLSPVFVNIPDTYMKDIREVPFTEKLISKAKSIIKSQAPDSLEQYIAIKLNNNYPEKLLKFWYNIKNDGSSDIELLKTRGEFNETYFDKIKAEGQQLNNSADAAEKLISNSHIFVFDFSGIKSMKDIYDETDIINRELAKKANKGFEPVERLKNGFKGSVKAYLYKFNYNEKCISAFFDTYYKESDKINMKKLNNEVFTDDDTTMQYIESFDIKVDATQFNEGQKGAPEVQLSKDELFNKAIEKGFEKTLRKMTAKYEPFKVKSKILCDTLINAPIGRKEGLKLDQLYFVYRGKDNEWGEKEYNKIGAIRAKNIVDNTIDSLKYNNSVFYQTWGIKPTEADIVREKNDLGMGVMAGYSFGNFGGIFGRFEYNGLQLLDKYTNKYFTMPAITSMKIYGEIAFQQKAYGGQDMILPEVDYNFFRFNVGLSKDFYFLRNFHVTPFIGIGAENASFAPPKEWEWDEQEINFAVTSTDLGARFAANLFIYNLQAIASVHYNLPISEVKITDENDNELSFYDENGNTKSYKYHEFFDGRKGLYFDLGIRFQF